MSCLIQTPSDTPTSLVAGIVIVLDAMHCQLQVHPLHSAALEHVSRHPLAENIDEALHIFFTFCPLHRVRIGRHYWPRRVSASWMVVHCCVATGVNPSVVGSISSSHFSHSTLALYLPTKRLSHPNMARHHLQLIFWLYRSETEREKL